MVFPQFPGEDFTRQSTGFVSHRECKIETEKEKMNEGHIEG
jgi:hypothetical protein